MRPARPLPNVLCIAALVLSACATEYTALRDSVVITGSPRVVERCVKIGFVAIDSPLIDERDGHRQLREATYRRGGNTVLVRSPATSTDGSAYFCDPPVPR